MAKVNLQPGRLFCPLPLYIIGTNNADGSADFATVTWMASNWNGTPHIMVGLGSARQARENVQRDGQFTMNMVSSDIVWLADRLGSSVGSSEQRDALSYDESRGHMVDAPILTASKLIFECVSNQELPMEAGASVFFGEIKNILLDEAFRDMDLQHLDLRLLDPVLFAPYQYFSIGNLLGPCDGWLEHVAKTNTKL